MQDFMQISQHMSELEVDGVLAMVPGMLSEHSGTNIAPADLCGTFVNSWIYSHSAKFANLYALIK